MTGTYFKYIIIGSSLTVGWLFWFIVSAAQALVKGTSFMSEAFTGLSNEEIFLRSTVMCMFLMLGIVMVRLLAKNEKAEEALIQEKEKLSVTLRSIGDGVIASDTEGKIILMNVIAEELTGWHRKEAIGRPFTEVFRIIDEKTKEPLPDPISRVLESGGICGLSDNTILVSVNGSRFSISDTAAPIRNRSDDIIGAVIVFSDITDKKKREDEERKHEKLEAIGVLAGGIAHEFNNILTGVIGNINLLHRRVLDPELVQLLQETEQTVIRARELTSQLLTFSKGGAPVRRKIKTVDFIKRTTDGYQKRAGIVFKFEIPDELNWISVDHDQMKQVIRNILNNADQAMPDGGVITIGAENVVLNSDDLRLDKGEYVRLFIRDEGIGIPEEYMEKVFDPYFTTKQMGNGLGLTSAYSVISKHNGFIDVNSTFGEGTEFSMYLPVSKEGTMRISKEELPVAGEKQNGHKRVLIMDDEEMIRVIAERVLSDAGYEVEGAVDGEESITKYRNAKEEGHPFNAVIMDLSIPVGMGGKEAIGELKKIDPNVRAIVSSGYSSDPIMASYQEYGFMAVVMKPYEIEELEKVVGEVVNA